MRSGSLEAKLGNIKRKFLKVTIPYIVVGGIVAGAVVGYSILKPGNADACIDEAANAFYETIVKPVVLNPQLLQTDEDGKVYVQMNLPKDVLLDAFNNPEKYESQSDLPGGKEPLHPTLESALSTRHNQPYNYVVELNGKGEVNGVYDGNGVQLPLSIARFRGLNNCRPSYSFK